MGSRGRISADGDAMNDVARRIEGIRADSPSEIPGPPAVHEGDLASAGRDAADALRLSLNAYRADLDTLAENVRQTVMLWHEHEQAMVSLLDAIEASFADADTTMEHPQ